MIVGVAHRKDGKLYTLPRPNRHHDLIAANLDENGRCHVHPDDSGFVDEHGVFYDRYEAATHAIECGQIERCTYRPGYLFSEDLW